MYLCRNRRRKRGEDYDYWTLVESLRTAKGPRQRIVGHIGKHLAPGRESVGWEQVASILSVGRFCEQASELALGERWYA